MAEEEEELQGEDKVKVMIEALKSHQLFVRSTATEQLTLDILEDPNFVLPIIVKEIADPEWWTVRFGITEAIQESAVRGLVVPEQFVKDLLGYLNDEDVEYRAKLALCLGDVKNKMAVQPLLGLLSQQNDEVRENAAIALGKINDEQAAPALIKLIESDSSDYVRESSIKSIGNIYENKKDIVNISPLIAMLKHSTQSIQTVTAVALGQIKNQSAIVPLIHAMDPTRKDLLPESRQIMLDNLRLFSEDEILAEIQKSASGDENKYLDLLDETLFQNPFAKLQEESETNKAKLIPKYQRQFKRVKNEIDGINSFVADVFKNLASINDLEELETIRETIPRKRANLERLDIKSILKYAWVQNSLYLELKEAEKNFNLGISALFELENAVNVKYEKLGSHTSVK